MRALLPLLLITAIAIPAFAAEDPVRSAVAADLPGPERFEGSLYFLSEPGDYIGAGQELTLTQEDGTFGATPRRRWIGRRREPVAELTVQGGASVAILHEVHRDPLDPSVGLVYELEQVETTGRGVAATTVADDLGSPPKSCRAIESK